MASYDPGPDVPTPNTAITATNGQVWTASAYVRLVAGSLANVSYIYCAITQRGTGGANVGDVNGAAFVPTNAPLATQRYALTGALSSASTL